MIDKRIFKDFDGEVYFDSTSKSIYSVDASIFEIEPIGVVVPRNQKALQQAVEIASEHQLPIIPRGAATGIAGGCIGRGLVIDTSKYLTKFSAIDLENCTVTCEPGVIQDDLNQALKPLGYRLGPSTSTGNRATIGGMFGNNSGGAHSIRYGNMKNAVVAADLILSGGEKIHFQEINEEEWHHKRQFRGRESTIYQELHSIKRSYHSEIAKYYKDVPRAVSGYNLGALVSDTPLFNPCKLLVGSEGSLGVASSITLKIVPLPKCTALAVLHYSDLFQALKGVQSFLSISPYALELIDSKIIEAGRSSSLIRKKLNWLKGEPKALILVEFEGESREELKEKIDTFQKKHSSKPSLYHITELYSSVDIADVWSLRKSGLGLLLSKRSYSRAIGFIEDFSVNPKNLAPFMEQFLSYLKEVDKEAGIYGHVGDGCLHVRPYIDLRDQKDLDLMVAMMKRVNQMLLQFDGVPSGEHGDGLIRSWMNPLFFSKRIYEAFLKVKELFDPEGLMNPGKVIHNQEVTENLRLSPSSPRREFSTFLDFSDEGGIELAADLCNGNAACRKKEGVMCPSFQATGDEYSSTRGRAQVLRAMINGRREGRDLSSKELYEVLDLCLECKGCKSECPSQVDMAKMKSEALYHYQKKYGRTTRSKLFAQIATFNKIVYPFRRIINWAGGVKQFRSLQKLIGIAGERTLPPFAEEKFSHWVGRREKKKSDKKVVLFNDTFTEFNSPSVGKGAVNILEKLGYEVIVPPWRCCGRPMLSKGFLPEAKKQALAVKDLLLPFAEKGYPIIGLEPSCILTIIDDYASLIEREEALKIKKSCSTFDQLIAQCVDEDPNCLQFLGERREKIVLHGHCHQKSLVGMEATKKVLRACFGGTDSFSEIPSGCCGMAGSFGYEKEHYSLSMKIGELKLFPAIREVKEESYIVANGFSCRSQIEHGTGKKSVHLAEMLSNYLESKNRELRS